MVTEIVDASADLAIAPGVLWDLLTDPRNYARVFPGIGACDVHEIVDGRPVWRMRIGGSDTEIHILDVRVIADRAAGTLELQCTERRSFAAVALSGSADRTRATITCVAPDRVHPLMPSLPNAAAAEWISFGLHRLVDLVRGAPTSMVLNGEDSTVRTQAGVAMQILSTGVLRSIRPDRMYKQINGLATYGFTLAGGYAAMAGHTPKRIAVVDDRGASSFGDIHARSGRLATALAEQGIGAGDVVGLLARSHLEMIEIVTAVAKLGADLIFLTTWLPAQRIASLAESHRMAAIFADPELAPLTAYVPPDVMRFSTFSDPARPDQIGVEELIAAGRGDVGKPDHPGRQILLTAGTSGPAKVAVRPQPRGFSSIAALLSRLPFVMNETMLIAASLSHSWGLAAMHISLPLRAQVVLLDRFDAAECLRLIAEHRVRTLIVVPIMVERILDLPASVRARYDLSSLEVVTCGGAPLSEATVLRFTEIFGEILYTIYGSTEVSLGAIAEPADLRVSPTTAGSPPLGAKFAVLDHDSRLLPVGAIGRVFVGHHLLTEGYIDAPPPEEVDGMIDTGDVGYVDAVGRLFVVARAEELIVCDGQTVYPRPVEEALAHLPQISESAVVGGPDRESGQRLSAFIVARPGYVIDADAIRDYIRVRLGRAWVPRDVVVIDALPRNASGNILKRVLTQQPVRR
ncbi:AMP-binding protein [Nocardia jiangxiensis]|uniref:AMP-binding protein n=1 Tax=Nocardia jiangxiensis TaxID=282685 RepID=UPI00031CC8BE|nr:AMP-binding protein [Nocardia jiangxiensis]